MGFHQHAQAVAQLEVAVGEARRRHPILEARGRVVMHHERGVERQRQRALCSQVGDHRVAPGAADLAQARVAGVQRFDLDGDVVLELGAVGGVQVDGSQRVPFPDQAQHRLHFRRVGLHVIAVEVEVLRGGAPAGLFRAALVGPVPAPEALEAVDVEHRHEQPHQPVQRAGCSLAFEHLAQGQETGVLAIDLAGVDAALDQHHRQAAALGLGRIERAGGGDHQQLHRPALGGGAEAAHGDLVRVAGLEGGGQAGHFLVATGALEARTLGFRDQRRSPGTGRGRLGVAGRGGQAGGGQQQARQGRAQEHRQGLRWHAGGAHDASPVARGGARGGSGGSGQRAGSGTLDLLLPHGSA